MEWGKIMAVLPSEVSISSDVCNQMIFYPILCIATRIMKTDLLFWAVPQPLTVAQAGFVVLLQLTFFILSSIFFYSASSPFLAAAVPPLKPEAKWKVGCCACLVQDCTELVCVWLWRCHGSLQLDCSGAEQSWGEGMSPCTAQLSSRLCALTGREEGEQVCLWYGGRFLNLAFVQRLCYCLVATRSCEDGDSRQRWLYTGLWSWQWRLNLSCEEWVICVSLRYLLLLEKVANVGFWQLAVFQHVTWILLCWSGSNQLLANCLALLERVTALGGLL